MQPLRFARIELAIGLLPLGLLAGCGGDDAVATQVAPLTPRAALEPGALEGDPSSPAGLPGESGGGPLPDLVLDAAYLRDTVSEDSVDIEDACMVSEGCVSGMGQRRVVRFGSRTGNLGTADLRLGAPSGGNPYWTFDSCQEEFDLVGFARYELFSASATELAAEGGKNGFCISDAEPYFARFGGPRCASYDCNRQGIGRGCADNYGSALECQWVDITGVRAGAYTLRVTLNANRAIAELDYENNVVEVNLEITDDQVRIGR
jgi:hypothetical protein